MNNEGSTRVLIVKQNHHASSGKKASAAGPAEKTARDEAGDKGASETLHAFSAWDNLMCFLFRKGYSQGWGGRPRRRGRGHRPVGRRLRSFRRFGGRAAERAGNTRGLVRNRRARSPTVTRDEERSWGDSRAGVWAARWALQGRTGQRIQAEKWASKKTASHSGLAS